MDTFGKRFKEERLRKRLTQEQLATKFHLKKSSISRYENDKQMPEVNLLKSFADFFETTVDYLIGDTDNLIQNSNVDLGQSSSENSETGEVNTTSHMKFDNAQEAVSFILKQKSLLAFGVPELTDEEMILFANDILQHIELVSNSYKFKNKDKNK